MDALTGADIELLSAFPVIGCHGMIMRQNMQKISVERKQEMQMRAIKSELAALYLCDRPFVSQLGLVLVTMALVQHNQESRCKYS